MKHDVAISIAELLATLSEGVRLRLLRLLEAHELSVGELAKVVQLPQSTVSRHLKILAEAGWLTRRSVGTATLYRLMLDDLATAARGVWVAVRGGMTSAEHAEDDRRLHAVLAERRLDSQAFFGRVAGEWDAVRSELFGAGFMGPALLSLLDPTWTVADVGCGTGNAAELLAAHVHRVVALDQSEPMLDAARRRLAGVRNVEFACGPIEKMPLDSGSVDAAVCVLVLHHLEKPALALAEMRRVLRPSRGVALVVDMLDHDRDEYRRTMGHRHLGFARPQIHELFRTAGFTSPARVVDLVSDPESKGPGLFAATCRS